MKKSKFTLIELLVVIAILSILMTLLLPSLQKAKQKSYAINCVGNLKQIGSTFAMYVNDNDEYFPDFYGYGGGGHLFSKWKQEMLWEYAPNKLLWYCPKGAMTSPYANSDTENDKSGYGYNWGSIGTSWMSSGFTDLYAGPAKLGQIKKTAETILAGDSYFGDPGTDTQYEYGRDTIHYAWYDNSGSANDWKRCNMVANRHSYAVNILWVDSHVNANPTQNKVFPYTDGYNPYLFAPFANATSVGHAENYWDRE